MPFFGFLPNALTAACAQRRAHSFSFSSLSLPHPWSDELSPPPPEGVTSGTASMVKNAIARLVSGCQTRLQGET